MRNLKLIILLILSTKTLVYGQWEEKNAPTSAVLTATSFEDIDHGYVVGGNQIYKTSNGGNSWELSFTGSSSSIFLEEVLVNGVNSAIAIGKDFDSGKSVIVKTSNSGTNWQAANFTSTSLLTDVFFSASTIGYCVGGNGVILKTTDAGNIWQNLNSGTGQSLESVYFTDNLHGFAVGGIPGSSIILRTQNGGSTWSEVSSPATNELRSVYFTSPQEGYIVGWDGIILKTTDGGNSWGFQNSVNMFGNLEVVFTDAATGYIVGGENFNVSSIQKTVNGGDLWVDIGPGTPAGLTSICFPSPSVGYTVGNNGTVLKTTSGGTLSAMNPLEKQSAILLYPNPVRSILQIKSIDHDPIESIKIFNPEGVLLLENQAYALTTEIDLSAFLPNNYYLEINTKSGKSIKKITKL